MVANTDLTGVEWRKSSYSGGGNDCVEVAFIGDGIATMVSGSVRVTSGSTSPVVGFNQRDWMPVFAFSASRSKIAMPVASEPVPAVVGQAMWGLSAPGTGLPSPTGALT